MTVTFSKQCTTNKLKNYWWQTFFRLQIKKFAIVMQKNVLFFNCNKFQFIFKRSRQEQQIKKHKSVYNNIMCCSQMLTVMQIPCYEKKNSYTVEAMSKPIFTSFSTVKKGICISKQKLNNQNFGSSVDLFS